MRKHLFYLLLSIFPFTGFGQLLNEGFEGSTFPPAGWTTFIGTNGIGTGFNWGRATAAPYEGSGYAFVRYENVTGGMAEDWMVTPAIDLSDYENAELTFYTRQDFSPNWAGQYYVKVSTTSQTNHTSFADVASWTELTLNATYNIYEQKTVDLSAYDGQTIYIAFVMVNDDGDSWYVDNVVVNADEITEGCLEAENGQWPSGSFTTTCSGELETITSSGWTGEYSRVQVTGGSEYIFSLSDPTYFITIGNESGTTVLASGTGSVTWTSPADQQVRFYAHFNSDCEWDDEIFISRFVRCGEILPPPANDDCENAIALSCGASETGNTAFATNSGGNIAGDVFYTYTGAGVEETVTVSLCGSNYDTFVRVFSDCTLTDQIASNDDSDACGVFSVQSELTFTSDGTSTYVIMVEGFGDNSGEFILNITCEGGGDFPAPYCGPLEFTFNIEPITNVIVAGISNASDPTVDGSPAHEDFTSVSGEMEQGVSYPIALEGNTAGDWEDRFVVFIDWNQNGVLNDAGEVYEMDNTITNSTGVDGQQALGTINVPADALEGATRMRVKKIFGTVDFLDPCLGTGYGQVEDYTLNVTAGGEEPEEGCFEENPESPQWPFATYLPACSGAPEVISNLCWTGEYSVLQVTAGTEYVFSSSIPTDFITISDIDGTVAYATGIGTTTWTSPSDQLIRFYLHLDDECDWIDTGFRSRIVQCGDILPPPVNDDCENAIALSCGDSETGSTVFATNSGGNGAPDVFYTYTGSGTEEMVTVSLCGSGYDTFVRVFSDCTLTEEIAFNDDSCGFQSEVSFVSDGTSTYVILVEGYEGIFGGVASGDYTINISCEEIVPPTEYCEPLLDCTDGDLITNVTFAGIDNDTDCSPNGYGNYTNQIANVEAGSTYSMSVTVGSGWTYESVMVWIDFNNNFIFEPSEYYFIGSDPGTTNTADIAIPSGTSDGQYRMRVRVGAVNPDFNDLSLLACDEDTVYGETEDYTINVGELEVSDLNSFNFTYYPNPVKDVLNISAKKSVESISIFNLTGQQVVNNAKVSNGQINVSALIPGTYVFRVTLEDGQIETFKIIKK